MEEVPERTFRPRRQYKIQEVIKRRQVMLVQVVKEERGNKGAALTTYLSLAGRYAVLMPNTARGGGISRKITCAQDRSRLKEVVQDLDVPEGMGIILRTAGASRTKPEIKRDFEYLIRMWETVRDMTLKSQAPTLVYEEGSLIKRSLRDLYNKEIDEIQVAGEAGYQEARDFMKMLMPSNVRAVKQYRDGQPLFSRMGVESQLDAMFSPTVQLRSGGYIVINQTEALVSIDVNSGRSTREHHIEDTALKTNLEAAEEVARQLRLRDLAGLIVIDFIDMDEKRNNRAVERKLSDCLRQDRARIQVGRISHFGLLEMSRQRIRASVLESSTEPCPQCGGTGHVRSVSSVALQLLRGIEEILMKGATHNLVVRTRTDVALYVLNHKRGHLRDLENSFKVSLAVVADATVERPAVLHHRPRRAGAYAGSGEGAACGAGRRRSRRRSRKPTTRTRARLEIESEIETEETEGLTDEAAAGEEAGGEGGASTASAASAPASRRGRGGEPREGGRAARGKRRRAAATAETGRRRCVADEGEAEEEEGDEQPGVCPRRAGPERRTAAAPPRTPWRTPPAWRRTGGRSCRLDRRRTRTAVALRKPPKRSPISTAARPSPRRHWCSPNRPSPQPPQPQAAPQAAAQPEPRAAVAAPREEAAQEAEKAAARRARPCAKRSASCRAPRRTPAPASMHSQPEPTQPLPRRQPRPRLPNRRTSRARPAGGRAASAAASSKRRLRNKKPPGKTGRFSLVDATDASAGGDRASPCRTDRSACSDWRAACS